MAQCDSNYGDLLLPSLVLCLYNVCSLTAFLCCVCAAGTDHRYRLNRVFRVILKTVFLGLKVKTIPQSARQNTHDGESVYVTAHLYDRELSKITTHDLLLLVLLLVGRLAYSLWTGLAVRDSYMYMNHPIGTGVAVLTAVVGLGFCTAAVVNAFAFVIIRVSNIRDMACRIVITSSLLALQAVGLLLAAERCASDPFTVMNNMCLLLLLTVTGTLTHDIVFTTHHN